MSLKPEEAKLCREYMKSWLIEEIRVKEEAITKERYKEYEPHILAYLLKHLNKITK